MTDDIHLSQQADNISLGYQQIKFNFIVTFK